MPFEENEFLMNQLIGNQIQDLEDMQQLANLQEQQQFQQFQQGQVNNYVNHTATIGTTQAVENTNYYDTYHHRINNYHTMNTNRYRDHYVDHDVYYNNTRNIYDGADYHRTNDFIVEPGSRINNGNNNQGSGRRYPGCGCRHRRRDDEDRRR